MPRTTGERNPSGSQKYSAKEKLTALMAITGLGFSGLFLTGCSETGNATEQSDHVTSSDSTMSTPVTPEVGTGDTGDTPESDGDVEKEAPSEYTMPPEHVHYNTILNEWWSLSNEEVEKLAKGPDFTKRAEFIAAMYMWLGSHNKYATMVDNTGIDIGSLGINDRNPVFMEGDIEDARKDSLDSIAGALDMFSAAAALRAKDEGKDPEQIHDITGKTWAAVLGPTPLVGGTKAGFSKASWDTIGLQEGQELYRRDTETRLLTTDELSARIEKSEDLKGLSYELIGVRIANKDNPEISTDRIFAMVPLDRRPDYDGNVFGFEFTDPGTPNTLGHPTKETILIPVPVGEFEN